MPRQALEPADSRPPDPRGRRGSAPRKPRRRSWWRRLGRLVGFALTSTAMLLLIGFGVFAGWLRSDHFQRWIGKQAEILLERETGEQATLTTVRVSFIPPAVAIDGLHVWHEETDETIASVERIRIPLVLRNGGPAIGRLQLQRPVLQLHVEADGKLREFRNRAVHEKGKPLERLPFGSLDVVDGAIRLYHPKFAVALEDLDVTPVSGPISSISGDLGVQINGLDTTTRFTWNDVALGPEVIEIPDLEIRSPILVLDGPARIDLDGPLDIALTGEIHLDELTPALVPPRASHGEVAFDLGVSGPQSDPTVSLATTIHDFGLDLPGKFTPLLTYELGDIVASATATKDHVTVEQATASLGEEGKLSAWGEIDLPNKRLVEGHAVGSRLSLAHLLRAFDAAPNPWIDMSTDLEVALSGPLAPLELTGPFEYLVADLKVGDRPIDRPDKELMLDIPKGIASGDLTLFKDHIVLRIDEVVTPRNHGNGVVDIGFGPKGPLDLTATLWDADLADFQPLRGVEMTGHGRAGGRFQGPFNQIRYEGWADLRDFSVLGIPYADHITADLVSPHLKTIELHDAKVTRGNSAYGGFFAMGFKPLTMDTDVVISKGRVEDVVGMFVDLDGMKGDLTGTLSLHGPLYDLDGEAHMDLSDVSLWDEHFDVGRGDGFMDKGRFTLDDLHVTRQGGTEGLVLRGSVEKAWKLDMELIAGGLDLSHTDHLSAKPIHGKLALHSRITNTLFDPSPDGRLQLTGLHWGNTALGDSVVWFDSRDGVATWHGLLLDGAITVDGTQGLWQTQPYHLVADLEKVKAHAFYPFAADGKPISATATGTVELSGHFGEVWSPVDLTADLRDVRVAWDRHVLTNPVPWRYEQDGRNWSLQGFGLQGGTTNLAINASGGDVLEMRGEGQVDVDLLRAVVPGMQRASGLAQVRLEAEGARPDVQAVVNVDMKADILRHSSVPASFEDTTARFRITEDRIDVLEAETSIGGGTLVGGGTIDAEGWIPRRYALSAKVDDAQIQWVESLPPATGDAELYFDGPTGALLLSGDVRIDDMSFSDRIDWEDWVVEARDTMLVSSADLEESEPYFSNNVAIHADHTIYLQNNVADGVASADLRVIGDTSRPGLVGEVNVQPGTLAYLQDREFRVDRGQLRFADPWTWDPDVDFVLVSDIVNQQQSYRVSYQVGGPFSNWTTSTDSDPKLPQADVNALLWFGVTTDQLEAMGQLPAAVAQSMADLVLSDIFLRSDAGSIRDELPDFLSPDRVDLATGVNARGEYSPEPRLVVEKRLDDVWDVQLSWEMNLVHPDDDYVSVEKRIGGIWSLSGWYASLQRARVLPIGGAYGVDVTATWEVE
jgi:hypothetical protein